VSDTSAGLFHLRKGPSYIFYLNTDPRVCGRRSYSTLKISEARITECWYSFNESKFYLNGVHTIYACLDHDMDLSLFVKGQHHHRMSQLGSHQHLPMCHCQVCSHPIMCKAPQEQLLTAQNELVMASISHWKSISRVHSIAVVSHCDFTIQKCHDLANVRL